MHTAQQCNDPLPKPLTVDLTIDLSLILTLSRRAECMRVIAYFYPCPHLVLCHDMGQAATWTTTWTATWTMTWTTTWARAWAETQKLTIQSPKPTAPLRHTRNHGLGCYSAHYCLPRGLMSTSSRVVYSGKHPGPCLAKYGLKTLSVCNLT